MVRVLALVCTHPSNRLRCQNREQLCAGKCRWLRNRAPPPRRRMRERVGGGGERAAGSSTQTEGRKALWRGDERLTPYSGASRTRRGARLTAVRGAVELIAHENANASSCPMARQSRTFRHRTPCLPLLGPPHDRAMSPARRHRSLTHFPTGLQRPPCNSQPNRERVYPRSSSLPRIVARPPHATYSPLPASLQLLPQCAAQGAHPPHDHPTCGTSDQTRALPAGGTPASGLQRACRQKPTKDHPPLTTRFVILNLPFRRHIQRNSNGDSNLHDPSEKAFCALERCQGDSYCNGAQKAH